MRQVEKWLRHRFAVVAIFLVLCSCLAGVDRAAAFPARSQIRPTSSELTATAQIRQIAAETSAIRSLGFADAMSPTVMDRAELRRELESELDDYTAEEQYAEERVLIDFRLAPDGIDLRQLYLDSYGGWITGYYDPEIDRLVLIDDDPAFDASERAIFTHELTHALQDQHFDLDAYWNRYEEDASDDAELAADALVEGDARVVEAEFMRAHPELSVQIRDLALSGEFDSEGFWLPPFLQGSMMFPYDAGTVFVRYLLHHGGWEAVNRAYADPPTTTEQVLHPDRYLDRDEPQTVTLPDLSTALGDGWQQLTENDFGEYQIGLMLAPVMFSDLAHTAPVGWDGDRYALWANSANDLIVWESAWDSIRDAREFAAAMEAYEVFWSESSFQSLDNGRRTLVTQAMTVVIEQQGNRVRYVVSPNPQVAQAALSAFTHAALQPSDGEPRAPEVNETIAIHDQTPCEVAPRSVESLKALLVAADADQAVNGAHDLSAGREATVVRNASAAESAAVTRTMLEYVTCENAGQKLRALALNTDDELRREWAWYWPPTSEDLADLADPGRPRSDDLERRVIDLRDVQVLSDGRIGALVTTVDPWMGLFDGPVISAYVMFVHVGDRWLIDEVFAHS